MLLWHTILFILCVTIPTEGLSHYEIKYATPGIYIEKFGDAQIYRGHFRVEMELGLSNITTD